MNDQEEAIFCAARERAPGDERDQYLDQACGDDVELRNRLVQLLEADRAPLEYLKTASLATIETSDGDEKVGGSIGPYKLLEQVGEGGMGTVFVAEQKEPVRRKVALKVIKQGMDSSQVVARFDAERQALALMNHANIAKVLDAGSTEFGRPIL